MDNNQSNDVQTLKKNVAAVHICNVPLMQRKLHNVLMFIAVHSGQPENTTGEYRISLANLISLLGYNSKDIGYLKSCLVSLSKNNVEWNLFQDDQKEIEWGTASLLASARIRKGHCYFAFPPPLERMLRNPELYAKIDLKIQRRFSSKYALALYENVIRFINLGRTRWIEVTLLGKILGVDESESIFEFKYLNRLLKKAVESVNEESDLFVKVEYKRLRRRIEAARFLVRRRLEQTVSAAPSELLAEVVSARAPAPGRARAGNPGAATVQAVSDNPLADQAPCAPTSHGPGPGRADLVAHLVKRFGFTADEAERLVQDYGAELIHAHLGEAEAKYRLGQVRWVRPYLVGMLKKATIAQGAEIEKERQVMEAESRRRENEKGRAKEEERARKQLEKDYLAYRAKRLEAVINSIEPDVLEALDERFARSIVNTPQFNVFKQRGFESSMIRALHDNFIVEQLTAAHPELSRDYYIRHVKEKRSTTG